jgi:aspartate aminotransferase
MAIRLGENPLRVAKRMSRIGREDALEVLARARELETHGQEIIHLEIGDPDFPTPPHVIEAGARALHDGWTHYGPPSGLPELREAVAEDVARRHGIPVDPAEVIITPGGKPILFFVILALVEEDEEVLFPNPGFPIYESMIKFVGGRAIPYALKEDNDFDVDLDEILERITDRTRLIILNSPHNPTGGVMDVAKVDALAEALVEREIFVLTDEIYSQLIYDGKYASIARFPGLKQHTIIADGFSKTYAMTGWRLGYGVMRQDLARELAVLMTNSNSCTASFTQIAGVAALRGDQACVDRMLGELRRRRSVMVDGINRIPGFRCRIPHGAFYAFPNITGTGRDSRTLADALLREAGVACLSGTAFGRSGEGYLRFSFANSIENLRKAVERIQTWAKNSPPRAPRPQG